MNYISVIKFENFRNLENQEINLSNLINIFIGPNGSGKTNILESISLFLPGRGLRKQQLEKITNFNNINKPWSIFCKYNIEDLNFELYSSYEKNINGSTTKKMYINGEKQKKLNKFKEIPTIIWFIPEMERLFLGPPSLRRNFIDRITLSFQPSILSLTNSYLKLIKERSNILQNKQSDSNWLDIIEEKIANLGIQIINERNKTISILNKTFLEIANIKKDIDICKFKITNNIILNDKEKNNKKNLLKYISSLKNSRNIDSIKGGCSIGPHKSELETIHIKKNISAAFCSTGQQKQIILSVLLCQSYYIIKNYKTTPIILLDEICSHLDERTRQILLYLTDWLKTQVLITGTEKKYFSFLSINAKFFDVINGRINILKNEKK